MSLVSCLIIVLIPTLCLHNLQNSSTFSIKGGDNMESKLDVVLC